MRHHHHNHLELHLTHHNHLELHLTHQQHLEMVLEALEAPAHHMEALEVVVPEALEVPVHHLEDPELERHREDPLGHPVDCHQERPMEVAAEMVVMEAKPVHQLEPVSWQRRTPKCMIGCGGHMRWNP